MEWNIHTQILLIVFAIALTMTRRTGWSVTRRIARRTDWSRFAHLPAFEAANRRNAYRAYLQMQDELLSGPGR